MALESFDDFNSTEQLERQAEQKPFAFRDEPNSKEKTLEWLNQNFDTVEQSARSRFIVYRRHHALYKGVHWRFNDLRDSDRDIEYSERKPRHTVNFVQEMVDTKVSQMARFKTNVAVIPSHSDQSDINNAKGCKLLLDNRSDQIKMDMIHQEADKIKYIYGIVFQMVLWDKNCGPLHPSFRRLNEMVGSDIPSKYKKKLKSKGKPIHIGDVVVKNCGPDRIYPEINKQCWDDVNHFDYANWVYIEELKADYPQHADKIQENSRERYDFELLEIHRPNNMIMVREFFHKKTKYLPNGAYIKYTDDVILEWTDYPYDEDDLPFVWDGDIDVYGELWPRSFIRNIEQMQRYYNNIQSAQARDVGIGSAPKWVSPKGSTEIHSFNNEFTIMEFKGPIAPKLVANNPISVQSLEIQDRLEKQIAQQSKVYDITRGEVPQGVTANSALRFLDEQESQRTMTDEQKRKARVISVYRKMLMRMNQFYKQHDGRTVKMLGPNNEYLIKSIKKADFSKLYDIKLQNSSALPDTKTGRISTIVDLNMATQTDPVFTKEEVIKMLDLGLDDAFKDGATVAVDSAKQTLELLLEQEPAPEPRPWDDLMVHYSIFMKAIQSVNFKIRTDPVVQNNVVNHVMILENLMFERAKINQTFLMELMALDNYPAVFKLPAPLAALMPQPVQPDSKEGMDTSKIKVPNQENK